MKDVKDYKDYSYDPSSGGVINTNMEAYEAYKIKKEALQKKARSQSELSNKVEALEKDINSIKNLLNAIADKL